MTVVNALRVTRQKSRDARLDVRSAATEPNPTVRYQPVRFVIDGHLEK